LKRYITPLLLRQRDTTERASRQHIEGSQMIGANAIETAMSNHAATSLAAIEGRE
jgi:hypothetical protein